MFSTKMYSNYGITQMTNSKMNYINYININTYTIIYTYRLHLEIFPVYNDLLLNSYLIQLL